MEFLGVRVGTTEAEAQDRLARLGTRRELESEADAGEGADAIERELWSLRGTAFGFVALGVRDGRVVSMQVFARPHALRYAEVGDVGAARRLGYYIYDWAIPAEGDAPALRVEGRGGDPDYAGSISVTSR